MLEEGSLRWLPEDEHLLSEQRFCRQKGPRHSSREIRRDGGSEFMAQFETACQQRGIQLFVLPPRSPKLNGHVERAQRTHREESRLPAGRSTASPSSLTP